MTAPTLYPFQVDVIGRIASAVATGKRRILLVSPTGSGKTVIGGAIIRDAVERAKRIVFLCHRRELIRQTSEKLQRIAVDHGIIQAGFPTRPGERVQVASIATLHARAVRTRTIEIPPADLVMVDEAHHARARSWQRILECYPDAIILGMTATPCRGDGRGLGKIFDVMVECPTVAQLIAGGYLVGTRVYAPSTPDLAGIRVERGDYNETQLAGRMDQPKLVGDIVEHWHKLAERRRTVVFATGVAHSVHLRDEFRRSGVLAEHIDGSTPVEERDTILRRLSVGEIELVTNCMVLTEGWDQPEVSCLVLARPTKSVGLYRQMVGRVLRPAPGKDHALVLDHSGAVFAHGFAEDEITWTLDEDKKAANKAHASRGTHGGAPRLTTCPECAAVMFEGRGCSICGWKPRPRAESFDTADGVLGEFRPDTRTVRMPMEDWCSFYAQLLYIASERGYQRGWAGHKYKEKYGRWPEWRFVDPEVPTEATRAWVRSRQIAFAKSQQKASAA
jgi:superfamily II DNA or RNA helicase